MKMKYVSRRFRRFSRANEAVSALEYAILVGVIAVGIGAALVAFETTLQAAIAAIGVDIGTTAASVDTANLDSN